MNNENCIFCKIATGDIPSYTLYEDEDFRVFLDLSPTDYGHALIIPKNHYPNIFALDDNIGAKIFPLAKKIASALKEALHCDGVNILQNNGEDAGQTLFHFHVHVIPRYKGDKTKIEFDPNELKKDDADKILEAVKKYL